MREPISVRTYQKGDEREIVDLINVAYAQASKKYSLEKWQWKFRHTPSSLIAVAESGNQMIGHMAIVPVRMKVGEEVVTAGQAVDLVVHPDFRRKGVFLSLAKALIGSSEVGGVPVWYGFPNSPAYGGHLKSGWFDVGSVRIRLRFLNTHNVLTHYFGGVESLSPIMAVLSRPIDATFSALTRSEKGEDSEILQCGTFDERVDRLWDEVSESHQIAAVRDRDFLNWRYCEREDESYVAFVSGDHNEAHGYVVLALREGLGTKIGYIVDILARRQDVLHNMIRFSLDYFEERDADLVKFWYPHTIVTDKHMRRYGFLFSPRTEVKLIVRVNLPRLPKETLSQPANWYLTMGDSDQI